MEKVNNYLNAILCRDKLLKELEVEKDKYRESKRMGWKNNHVAYISAEERIDWLEFQITNCNNIINLYKRIT